MIKENDNISRKETKKISSFIKEPEKNSSLKNQTDGKSTSVIKKDNVENTSLIKETKEILSRNEDSYTGNEISKKQSNKEGKGEPKEMNTIEEVPLKNRYN